MLAQALGLVHESGAQRVIRCRVRTATVQTSKTLRQPRSSVFGST
ncbi:hypothetical protein [Pseudomonas sp. PSKL.D1]|nr:hypothetical protein [Pseudomonas sp. PSKL.D1]WDY56020.1 hypothetical protein PVV54_15575 [Pseudomonas sp. PSKL.D1]